MPAYNVTIVHTLRIVGTISMTARSQEAAASQAEQLAADGRLGTLTWHITDYDRRIDEWTEEEVNVAIEEVTED